MVCLNMSGRDKTVTCSETVLCAASVYSINYNFGVSV